MASMGKGGLEKVRRCLRTIYFMVVMLVSLLMLSAPVMVAMVDVLLPSVLICSFTCVRCYSFTEHLNIYDFKTSLMDIPLLSILRSLIISCTFLFTAPLFSCSLLSEHPLEFMYAPSRFSNFFFCFCCSFSTLGWNFRLVSALGVLCVL